MTDAFAPSRETTEGRVYNLTGGDFDQVLGGIDPISEERLVLNMGPQHPSTHGVLRLVLELEGETVTDARVVVGYLHTGIEKNTEFRTWTQGVTFLTRADYLAPFFNETVYCLGVEKLLGIEAPPRAQLIRVLMMEINRLSSHWVWLATGGMELGALTAMTNGFRAREKCLDVFELITGLRMNHAYVRPGGVAQDLPEGYDEKIRDFIKGQHEELNGVDKLLRGQPIWVNRLKNVGWIGVEGCIALGVTGPFLRAAGLAWDLRKTEPYLGYETFDFEVPTDDRGDSWARFVVKVAEMHESLKIIEQVLDRLEPGPTIHDDPKIAWPAKLSLGPDGMGNSLEHVQKIMASSMESLIHHFKLVTEGFRVPPGQVYTKVESPRGELGAHVISDGGTRPYRVHFREPSFINLQSVATLSVGGMVADVIASVASIDPVMGGMRPMTNFRTSVINLDRPGDPSVFSDQVRADAKELISRYPKGQARSALLPLLHLVQSEQGYVTPDGIAFCADTLDLTKAQVAAVVTFYTMYKRHPTGEYLVSVCTNTLCGMLGGDEIFAALREQLAIGNNETTPDGAITLEHAECLAACDYAPVVTVNYEFFDNQTVGSARNVVSQLQSGVRPTPSRGAPLCTFKQIERQIAGLHDEAGLAADAPTSGVATEAGVKLAIQRGDTAPSYALTSTSTSTSTSTQAATTAKAAPSGATSANDAPLKTSGSDAAHPAKPAGEEAK